MQPQTRSVSLAPRFAPPASPLPPNPALCILHQSNLWTCAICNPRLRRNKKGKLLGSRRVPRLQGRVILPGGLQKVNWATRMLPSKFPRSEGDERPRLPPETEDEKYLRQRRKARDQRGSKVPPREPNALYHFERTTIQCEDCGKRFSAPGYARAMGMANRHKCSGEALPKLVVPAGAWKPKFGK